MYDAHISAFVYTSFTRIIVWEPTFVRVLHAFRLPFLLMVINTCIISADLIATISFGSLSVVPEPTWLNQLHWRPTHCQLFAAVLEVIVRLSSLGVVIVHLFSWGLMRRWLNTLKHETEQCVKRNSTRLQTSTTIETAWTSKQHEYPGLRKFPERLHPWAPRIWIYKGCSRPPFSIYSPSNPSSSLFHNQHPT